MKAKKSYKNGGRTVTKESTPTSRTKTVTRTGPGGTITKTKTKQEFGSITKKSKSKTESTQGGNKVVSTSRAIERRKNPGQEAKRTVTITGSQSTASRGSQSAMKKTERFAKDQSLKKRVTRSGSATDYSGNTRDDMGGGLRYNRFGGPKKTIKGRSVTEKRR